MPEEIVYDSELDVTRVTSIGEISYDEWLKSLFAIEQLSEEHNCFDLLVDISGQSMLPDTLGLYKFGMMLPRSLRYALVSPFEVVGEHRFLETISANHGNLVSTSRNERDALAWLKRLPESNPGPD